ncbi:uncharacterized protein LOC105175944 [Sesamum indicum]|uniref:Uncharacterized protein LOC105175944 n=1 Tax=Sesamum indicum TaxID=4182 RepID=A0A6I9U7R9_SESIN|nr:uncharacterized protein LOC105175944 [Sesamum indicum]
MMSGTWSKLKKTLLFKSNAAPASSSPLPNQSDSSFPPPRSSLSSSSSSSSFSSRFSRSLSSSSRPSKKTCAICLGNVRSGQGQAIFTAECSHTFHFSCITNSVKHGNYLCPICRSKWKEIPLQLPSANADPNRNAAGRARVSPYQAPFEDYPANYSRPQQQLPPHRPEPVRYADDEPLPVSSMDPMMSAPCAPSNNVFVKAIPEFPAVAAPESVSDFAVLVGVRAPPLLDDARQYERAPIDLVTVLDVSGSMAGLKLVLLKRAVCFVIENLGPADRLSIVSFSSSAHRKLPLLRMTGRGREDAKAAVNSLFSDGGTDIVEGLKKGARILEERRERNPVASIILLSDGKHTFDFIPARRSHQNRTSSDLPRILGFTNNENNQRSFPVHAFGLGVDHDSSTMHAISDASGGTFSFIESVDMVQDAFARCIGGLLSVVAQELRLTMTSASPGVEIDSIPSGRYASEISDQGFQAVINVGDLYADEEKEFLVHLSIPECAIAESVGTVGRTSLLKISCSYRDTASKAMVQLEGERVEIRRPKVVSRTDGVVSLEVDRQRNRLWVAEGIAKAQEMAELGNLEGAQALLAQRRTTLLTSASAQAGDGLCSWLEAELMEIRERMENMAMYEHTGRAYVLSGLSSHSWQRATTRGYSGNVTTIRREGGSSSYSGPVAYDTPSMVSMVSKSQSLSAKFTREQVSRQNKSTPLSNA